MLGSLWRPIRPSFSMAMKLVRTLESGRGDSELARTEAPMAARVTISMDAASANSSGTSEGMLNVVKMENEDRVG